MSYEQLTKEELLSILEDKKTILGMKEQASEKAPKIDLSPEQVRSLTGVRCRACLGQVYEVPDPDNPVKKVTKWLGQPIVESAGGHELACRSCKHIRQALSDHGVVDLYI